MLNQPATPRDFRASLWLAVIIPAAMTAIIALAAIVQGAFEGMPA